MKKILTLTLSLILLAGCTTSNTLDPITEDTDLQEQVTRDYNETDLESPELLYDKTMQTSLPTQGEKIVILQTTQGDIAIKLFWDLTPTLAENFYTLASEGKYDDIPFHRVIEGFMIQSGDYENGDGTGGQSYQGKGLADEITTQLRHIPGALGAAKSSLPNSIGSQFYIVHQEASFLDGNYSVFGQVYSGQETIDAIASVPVSMSPSGEMSQPLTEVKITKAIATYYEAEGEIADSASDSEAESSENIE